MALDLESVSELKENADPNSWVDITATCTEIWQTSAERMQQQGLLTGVEGENIKFVSWEDAENRELDKGETYIIRDAQVITDASDERSILFRASSEITTTDALDADGEGESLGPDCIHCGKAMPTDAYTEGPGAPEIGWEYYHCPHCDTNMRPEVVNHQ